MAVTLPIGSSAELYLSEDWDGTAGDGSTTGVAAATWVAIDGLGDYTRSGQANTTAHRIFMRSSAVTTVGIPDRTVTLNGWFAQGDPAQDLLRSYGPDGANANTNIGFAFLRDGDLGYAVMVQVGGGDESANAEGGLQPVSFTLAPQADPVDVETGWIV